MPAGTGREQARYIVIVPRVQMEKSLKALPVAYLGQCGRLASAVQRPVPLLSLDIRSESKECARILSTFKSHSEVLDRMWAHHCCMCLNLVGRCYIYN